MALLSGVVVADEMAVPDWIKQARAERPAIKKRYGALYDEVSAILYRHDPMGLAPLAPSDEYDPEVGTILPRLKECRSEQEFRRCCSRSSSGGLEQTTPARAKLMPLQAERSGRPGFDFNDGALAKDALQQTRFWIGTDADSARSSLADAIVGLTTQAMPDDAR